MSAFALGSALSLVAQQTPPIPESPGSSTKPAPGPYLTLTPRSREERELNYRAEHRIILNLLVTDRSGLPATGLKQEDFTLLDNGQPRSISAFREVNGRAPAARVHVILVLDAVNNNSRNIERERQGMEKFLAQNQGRLAFPVSIALLSDSGIRAGQPSQDGNALIGRLRNRAAGLHIADCADSDDYYPRSQSLVLLPRTMSSAQTDNRAGDCLNHSFQLSVSSLNRLAKQQADVLGRVILIWIGPGWPLLSGPEFRPDTPAEKRNFYDYLVDLSTSMREAQVTLDAVSSPELSHRAEPRRDSDIALLNGVPSEDKVSAASLSLEALARQSGGRVLNQDRNIAGHIASCLADAQSYYVLSFDSPPAETQGEFHPLEVKLGNPALTVRTNTAYYALP